MYTTSKEKKQPDLFEQLKSLAITQGKSSITSYTSKDNCASITDKPCEFRMPNIAPVEAIQIQQNLEMAREAFARMSTRVQNRILESDRGQDLLFKAFSYNIPFNPHTVNFLDLEEQIDEYEELLKTAQEYYIDWDMSEYDPVALQQEIEYHQRQELEEANLRRQDYFASRGI